MPKIAVTHDVMAQRMPAYTSKFWIRFAYFKNAMYTLLISFYKVVVRYHTLSYGENVEKFCACTKFCDVHNVWLYVLYTVSISWAIVFNRKQPLRVSYFWLYTFASVSLVYVLRTKCKNIYQNVFLFIDTCTRGRDECVYVWVRVCMID